MIKITADTVIFQHFLKLSAGESGNKTERLVFNAEACKNDGNIDSLAAVIDSLM